ncbi:hypothetical protein BV25DRAFT_1921840 [Artomyces pyxidatus]|uniref:Uncharacterized protein n=1 Tax=Artomyces pyxidatus TaxID=48021 RepID=A0ACB8SGQ8_9AGAM|nr:hypothetical protein BV25DRAFT_1921840 [Artomyces pyxidatus]
MSSPDTTHSAGVAPSLQADSQEVAQSQEANSSIPESQHSLSPIAKVPFELLALLFLFYVRLEPPRTSREHWQRLGWIKIASVCRRWRNVALSSANLWTQITLALPDQLAETMASYAKSAPLAVNAQLPWPHSGLTSPKACFIIDHLPNTKILHIVNGEEEPFDLVLAELARPAPLLESITIDGATLTRLPDNFLGTHPPKLRSIAIDNPVNFPWTSSVFNNLIDLQILFYLITTPLTPSLDELISSLNNMPSLRRLTLMGFLPHGPASQSATIARLPRLTRLQLRGSPSQCTNFLTHLDVPTSARLQLHLDHSLDNRQQDITTLCHALSQYLHANGTSTKPVPSLVLRVGCSWTQVFRRVHQERDTLHVYVEPELAFGLVKALLSKHVIHFHVFNSPFDITWTPRMWLDVMAGAPGLRSISAGMRAAQALCFALEGTVASFWKKTNEQFPLVLEELDDSDIILLPILEELALDGVDFKEIMNFIDHEGTRYKSLRDPLLTRANAKRGLQKLELVDCGIEEEHIEELRGLVGDVVSRKGEAYSGCPWCGKSAGSST